MIRTNKNAKLVAPETTEPVPLPCSKGVHHVPHPASLGRRAYITVIVVNETEARPTASTGTAVSLPKNST